MRHRLALVAQTLWAAVHGLASLQITHGCQAWLSWAPLGRRSETRLGGILGGLANLETRWREARKKEKGKGKRNRSRPCHRLLAATCFTTRFAWR
jgi:hypothetical protein